MTNRVFFGLLIVFFSGILICQLLDMCGTREGMENATTTTPAPTYKDYDTSNPNNAMILAQQNAGNIIVLKGQIDDMGSLKKKVDDLSSKVDQLSTQVDSLVQQQADYAQDLAGSTPADVSGTN